MFTKSINKFHLNLLSRQYEQHLIHKRRKRKTQEVKSKNKNHRIQQTDHKSLLYFT